MNTDVKDVTLRTFNVRLQEVIKRLKVAKKDFAKAGGVTPQALTGYLKGERRPDHETIAKWCREYNLNANYLLLYLGTMFRSETDNTHPMELEAPGQECNPPQSSVLGVSLGPVAERVDGIERASKGMPLTDLLPFVVKVLKAWYDEEFKKINSVVRESEGLGYAHEDPTPKKPPEGKQGYKPTRD